MDRMFGHYRIVDRIGRGGMGEVFRAEDLKLRRTVALKLLPGNLSDSPLHRERLIREAVSASRLTHVNIATIYEVDEVDGQVFLSMEYIEGESLQERLARATLTEEQIVRIGGQIAEGLAAAHEQGVVHRDIKPANVLLTAGEQVKIVDFGLALEVAPTGSHTTDTTAVTEAGRLTRDGSAVGTVAYMSPEQASGETPDTRSDIFALGVVLYEMATGKLPFSGNTPLAMAASIIHDKPTPFSAHEVTVAPGLREIVQRCLIKDRRKRPTSATQVAEALGKLGLGHSTGSISQVLGRKPGARRALIAALLMGVLAASGWIGFQISRRQTVPEPPPITGVEAGRAFSQGESYEQRGSTLRNMEVAEQMYRRASQLEGTNPYLKASLARFLTDFELAYPGRKEGRLDEARRLTAEALAIDDGLSTGWVARARLLLIDGDAAEAIEAAKRAIRLDVHSFRGEMLLGEALVAQGDVEAGLNALRRAIGIGHGHIFARPRLAFVLFDLGKIDEAAVEYRKMLEYAPDSPSALNNLAVIHLTRGNYLEAIRLLEQSLELQPDDYAASNLGSAYFFIDRMDKAIAAFRKSVEISPEMALYKQNLAEALEKVGDAEQARLYFEKALEDYDRDLPNLAAAFRAETLAERAFCAAKVERFDEALVNIDEALELAPENGYCLRAAARVHALAGDRARSFDHLRQAVTVGYPREDLRRDSAFAVYVDDAEFLEILTEPAR